MQHGPFAGVTMVVNTRRWNITFIETQINRLQITQAVKWAEKLWIITHETETIRSATHKKQNITGLLSAVQHLQKSQKCRG